MTPDETASAEDAAGSAPAFRVVRGHPTEEELAALLVVLSARAAAEPTPTAARTPASGWASYAQAVRAPLQPGPGAWRASARPA